MHRDLEKAFLRVIEILKSDHRCKGGWHYGSINRGESDLYSDYDPVFLVADADFKEFASDVPKILTQVSDELLIFWGESFNDDHFKNYCSVIRLGENLHMLIFYEDAKEICKMKGIVYPETIASKVMSYFENRMSKHAEW